MNNFDTDSRTLAKFQLERRRFVASKFPQGKCGWCGAVGRVEIDHAFPKATFVSLGFGDYETADNAANKWPLCIPCHARKTKFVDGPLITFCWFWKRRLNLPPYEALWEQGDPFATLYQELYEWRERWKSVGLPDEIIERALVHLGISI